MSQSSEASGSRSSDGGQKGVTSITFNMHRNGLNQKTGLGTFRLEMPSWEGMPNTQPNAEYPRMLLEIKDDDQTDSLTRMKKLQHENILAVHFFDKDEDGDIRAYVEPYTGSISDLFNKADFFIDKETGLVPSPDFQEIVRESLDGLDCVIKNGLYHGNFSWETTVYHQDKDGKQTLKLCNFENRENKTLLDCQIGDCHALAHSLEKVSQRVQKEYVGFQPETCCLLDDLARRLRAVNNKESLSTMKQDNQDCVFFWDGKRKRTFCAYEMPAVWFQPAFLESLGRSQSLPTMPWDTLWKGHALLSAMKKYRLTNKIAPYKFDDINDFLRFISGLYTHEIELKVPLVSVDAVVHRMHPRLLLDLKAAAEVDPNAMDVDNQ